jgi:hypothetical protein
MSSATAVFIPLSGKKIETAGQPSFLGPKVEKEGPRE